MLTFLAVILISLFLLFNIAIIHFLFRPSISTEINHNLNLLILHTNDVHARYQEVNRDSVRCDDETSLTCFGGFARLRAAVEKYTEEAKAEGIPTLYLDAGDVFQGTVFYTEYKWELAAKMVDTLGIQVMSLGNHEFDDAVVGLAPYVKAVSVPIVCCNIDVSEEPSLQVSNLTPSKVVTINGYRIGIIGYLTKDIPSSLLGKVKILDEIPSIRAEAQKLLREGVKIIIALGHSGYKMDLQIAEAVEELDIVVGGHSHTFLYSGTPPSDNTVRGPYPTVVTQSSGKRVPVVQASYGTKYLGFLKVVFDKGGKLLSYEGLPILLKGDMPQDNGVLEVLSPYAKEISEKYRKKLGTTEVLLEGKSAFCKFRECNIGNLITDAFLDYAAKNHISEDGQPLAQLAVLQSGSIKSNLFPKSDGYTGDIVLEDVMTVLPFASRIFILRLTGSVLRDALEHAVSRYEPEGSGLFKASLLQVSGLRVSYDLTQEKGQRLTSVEVWCADLDPPAYGPLDMDKTYGVAMPKYLADGGDNFVMLKPITPVAELEEVDYMIVAKYIEERSPISATVEGRITIIEPQKPSKS